jgi:hypothetical protein
MDPQITPTEEARPTPLQERVCEGLNDSALPAEQVIEEIAQAPARDGAPPRFIP